MSMNPTYEHDAGPILAMDWPREFDWKLLSRQKILLEKLARGLTPVSTPTAYRELMGVALLLAAIQGSAVRQYGDQVVYGPWPVKA